MDNDLTFDILFNPEGTVRLDNYRLDFGYDTTELVNWTNEGGSFMHTPPTGLSEMFGQMKEEDVVGYTPGFLWNLNACTFGQGPDVSSEITLGTITFGSLSDDAVQDGEPDLWFNVQPLVMATIDGEGYYINYEDGTLRSGDNMDVGGPSTILPGDINDDDIVDLTDVMLTLQIATGLTPTDPNMDADVNEDGKIGAEESIYVVQTVAGLR
jgi:hypothetical protein